MPIPIITTAGDLAIAAMLREAQEQNTAARQADAAKRLFMLSENWRHVVYAYIASMYKTDAVRKEVSRRVKATFNVLLQITRRVCVVYKQPPVRRLKGASQAAQDAWAELMRESEFATRMQSVERNVFAANVDIVVPRVFQDPNGRGPRLRYEELLPHCTEVETSEFDPMGGPSKATYSIKSGSDYAGRPLTYASLDADARRFFDDRGQVQRTELHGAGVFPGVDFRLEHPTDDWWCSHRGSGIVDATVECAHLAARMDWVRNGQDRYREYMAAENLQQIPQQVAGAEGPVQIPLNPQDFSYQVLDVNTPIENHEKHLRLYLHQAAESIGIPSVLVDFDFTGTNSGATSPLANAAQHAALADLRSSHIEWYRSRERELAWRTALVLQGANHPLARLLPPDMVLDSFEVDFPDLTYVEDPKTRVDVSTLRIQAGLSSTVREYQREHPELTIDEAKAQVIKIAEEEGELNELYIRNNWPRGAAGKQTLAQAQGTVGGQASGVARQDTTNDPAAEPGRADATQQQ